MAIQQSAHLLVAYPKTLPSPRADSAVSREVTLGSFTVAAAAAEAAADIIDAVEEDVVDWPDVMMEAGPEEEAKTLTSVWSGMYR